MLWTHPKMTFKDLSPSIHIFVVPSLWMWTGTLWLASTLRNVAEVTWYHSPGYNNPSYKTPSQQPEAGASPCGLDVARWPLGWGTTSCQQEARAFSDETTRKETVSARNPALAADSSSVETLYENTAQSTPWSQPQESRAEDQVKLCLNSCPKKLQDNKCVLF